MRLLLVLISLSANTLWASEIFDIGESKRIIKLIGRVDEQILKSAQQIDSYSLESSEPIYMLINSPGGELHAGLNFVDAMRAAKHRGVEFHCASQVLAASMAMIILNECQHRYATGNTRLMFHLVHVTVPSATKAGELAEDLIHTIHEERRIAKHLRQTMKMSKTLFYRNYRAQTVWAASELCRHIANKEYITLVKEIRGFGDDLFRVDTSTPNPKFPPFPF